MTKKAMQNIIDIENLQLHLKSEAGDLQILKNINVKISPSHKPPQKCQLWKENPYRKLPQKLGNKRYHLPPLPTPYFHTWLVMMLKFGIQVFPYVITPFI